MALGVGLRVEGRGSRVLGSGFRVQGFGFRVQGSGFKVQGPHPGKEEKTKNQGFFSETPGDSHTRQEDVEVSSTPSRVSPSIQRILSQESGIHCPKWDIFARQR